MSDIVHRIWNKYLGVNTPAAELVKDASAEIESLRRQLKDMTDKYNAALEAEQVRYRQVVEKDAEIEGLNFKLQNQALDCIAADGQAFDSWQQLAVSQARDQLSLDALNVYADAWNRHWKPGMPILQPLSDHVFSLPKDTTALEAIIAKAGEVMRERALARPHPPWANYLADGFIRTLPPVKLEDLK